MKKMLLAIPSNMRLKIREAGKEDAKAAWKLIAQLQEFVDLEITPYEEFAARWEKAIASENFKAFIAEEGEEAKGLATVWLRESLSHGGLVALIDELVVAEGERGKGIGTHLLKHVVDNCFQMGCIEVEVSTEADNFAARGFYHKLGFGEVGVLLEREKEQAGGEHEES
jgi:PhnO protein